MSNRFVLRTSMMILAIGLSAFACDNTGNPAEAGGTGGVGGEGASTGTGGRGGEAGAGGVGGEGGEVFAEHDADIVISADFPEVYGATTVWIVGQEETPIRLEVTNQASCDNPAATVHASKVMWRAKSENGFAWEGELKISADACLELKLDVNTMLSGIKGIFSNGSCRLPFDVFYESRRIGTISSKWDFDPAGDLDVVSIQTLRTYILDATRVGKAVAVGFTDEPVKLYGESGTCSFESSGSEGLVQMTGF